MHPQDRDLIDTFYIDSLLNNYSYGGNQDQKLRHELEQELTYKGKEYLYEKLEKLCCSPEFSAKDIARIICKAAEILYNKKYKVIATSIDEWEKIRDDFNHKKKVFTFVDEKEETIQVEKDNLTNQIEDDFGTLITVE